MTFPTPAAADEGRHPPGDEPLWGESWYFDWATDDGAMGGYVRLGLYPNLGVAWYWACLVRPGEPLVLVADHAVPLPSSDRSLQVRTTGLWADHNCEEPLDRWSLGLEAFGLVLDDPCDAYQDEPRGELVPFGFELEWESDGTPFRYQVTDRYEIPCRVHGEVLLGDQALEIQAVGQRDHSWGVRDWWSYRWVWSAFHADDGSHLFGNAVQVADELTFTTGYVQGGPGGAQPEELTEFPCEHRGRSDGLVEGVRWELAGVAADVDTVAWAPLLLVAEDGRRSRFARALCRTTLDDGRSAVGWMEFNQPD